MSDLKIFTFRAITFECWRWLCNVDHLLRTGRFNGWALLCEKLIFI